DAVALGPLQRHDAVRLVDRLDRAGDRLWFGLIRGLLSDSAGGHEHEPHHVPARERPSCHGCSPPESLAHTPDAASPSERDDQMPKHCHGYGWRSGSFAHFIEGFSRQGGRPAPKTTGFAARPAQVESLEITKDVQADR